jgi:hypothetical protein
MRVGGVVWSAVHHKEFYTVFADTMKFRMNDEAHPLDVREVVP